METVFSVQFLRVRYLEKAYYHWSAKEYEAALRMFQMVRAASCRNAEAAYCIEEVLKDMMLPACWPPAHEIHPGCLRDPSLWEVSLERGWSAFMRGDYQKAHRELSQAVQILRHMARISLRSILPHFHRMNEARFLLAQTCVRLGRIPEARFLFASISPSSYFYPFAQQRLLQLELPS